MKQNKKMIGTLLAALLLTGCTSAQQSQAEQSEPQQTQSSAAENENALPTTMPLISIETVNRDPNVLDFVTEPVAAHVSEQIASWTPHYKMPPAPYYETCSITVTEPDGSPQPAMEAEVKVRGNWTTNYQKKPLRLKFTEKQNLLGLNDGAQYKNWLLLAEYKDASLLRDKTALAFSRELLENDGLYAADTKLVEVQINGEYWGVYLLTEQQQTGSERVNITEPEADYAGTDIGYFLEFDGYYYQEEPLQQFHVDYADNAPLKPYDGKDGSGKTMTCLPKDKNDPKKEIGMTIKSRINSQEQHDFIASYVNNVYNIMYAAAYENKAYAFNKDYTKIAEAADLTPQQAVEQVVDVQSLADAYIIAEMTCDADIYWSSFYMSADFGAEGNRKLTFQAPWDFDSGLGNKNRCMNGKRFYAANIVPDVNAMEYDTINPWLAVLMYQDWYQEIIRNTWKKANDNGIFTRAAEMIAQDKTAYRDAFARNDERWGCSTRDEAVRSELSEKALMCRSQEEAADFLSEWVSNRINFMNENWT